MLVTMWHEANVLSDIAESDNESAISECSTRGIFKAINSDLDSCAVPERRAAFGALPSIQY